MFQIVYRCGLLMSSFGVVSALMTPPLHYPTVALIVGTLLLLCACFVQVNSGMTSTVKFHEETETLEIKQPRSDTARWHPKMRWIAFYIQEIVKTAQLMPDPNGRNLVRFFSRMLQALKDGGLKPLRPEGAPRQVVESRERQPSHVRNDAPDSGSASAVPALPATPQIADPDPRLKELVEAEKAHAKRAQELRTKGHELEQLASKLRLEREGLDASARLLSHQQERINAETERARAMLRETESRTFTLRDLSNTFWAAADPANILLGIAQNGGKEQLLTLQQEVEAALALTEKT